MGTQDPSSDQSEDMALVAEVCAGDPAAIARFDERFIARVPSQIHHLDPSPSFAAEVQQLTRIHLLVGEHGRPPRLAEFAGRGALGAFVRVVALRIGLGLIRSRRDDPTPEEAAGSWAVGADPEIDYLKGRYRPAFEPAFKKALGTLAPKERVLLRLVYCDKLTLAELAVLERVHISTLSRRIAALRARVFEATECELGHALGVAPSEVASLLQLVGSRLDGSLGRILRGPSDPGSDSSSSEVDSKKRA
jgi:RNA polymerase sigma-70 factor (ECF subfamily)